MLEIKYKDNKGRYLENPSSNAACLPEEVAHIEIDDSDDDATPSDFKRLSNMLKQTSRKLESITLTETYRSSPEFLALLISVSNTTEKLLQKDCQIGEASCTVLMASLMNPDGIADLEIENSYVADDISARHAQLLFEGVASSVSLKRLTLHLSFEESEQAGNLLVRALQQNQSLKSLYIKTTTFGDDGVLRNVIRAASSEKRLEDLTIWFTASEKHHLPVSSLKECLCRDDCNLEILALDHVSIEVDVADFSQDNSSLTRLDLVDADLTCSQVVDICQLFKSLKSLDISYNPISDLTPLDTLLFREGYELESLELIIEGISEPTWIEFFQKLPRIKSLRNLGITFCPFDNHSEAFRACFLDALWNSNLESVCFMDDDEDNEEVSQGFEEFRCQVSVPLGLNRGGRRALQNQCPDHPMYPNLWPLVLERAMKIDYYSVLDRWQSPTLETRRCDVVYWLLREKVLV
mmetsp:Transcript_30079/g.72196  ORF Transcript_30079/g.72196 Transcript_30079/m.72196 type:complete len:465 (-) Transcript_30079:288-1682(-)